MIRVEFVKQLYRLRTYIALGLMAFIPVLITLAVEFGRRPHDPQEQSFFAVATASGLNVPLAALTATSSFLLVVVVAVFAGAAVSEEANWGSLRYLLVRPVSRSRLLFSKLMVTCVLALIATVVISVSGLIAGVYPAWRVCRIAPSSRSRSPRRSGRSPSPPSTSPGA